MKFILVSSLLALAAATPIEHTKRGAFDSSYQVGSITSSQVVAAAPGSSSCAAASFASECHDSTKATPLLNAAFKQYKQTTLGEVAALLGLMSLESGDFQFNVNHFPGRPGQGSMYTPCRGGWVMMTRMMVANAMGGVAKAMLMFNFIYDYAVDAGMKSQVDEIAGSDQVSSMSDDKKNKIRALVTTDKYVSPAAQSLHPRTVLTKVIGTRLAPHLGSLARNARRRCRRVSRKAGSRASRHTCRTASAQARSVLLMIGGRSGVRPSRQSSPTVCRCLRSVRKCIVALCVFL